MLTPPAAAMCPGRAYGGQLSSGSFSRGAASQGTCPIKIIPGAPPRDRSHTYEQCLRQYGKNLDSGFDTRRASPTTSLPRASAASRWCMEIAHTAQEGEQPELASRCRWLKAAQRSAGKQRLNNLIQHVINTWMWTLDQRQGTPCMPRIITYRCSNDASCGGIGDRIKGQSMAFWMVGINPHSHSRPQAQPYIFRSMLIMV